LPGGLDILRLRELVGLVLAVEIEHHGFPVAPGSAKRQNGLLMTPTCLLSFIVAGGRVCGKPRRPGRVFELN
jgi:hypothetical protein